MTASDVYDLYLQGDVSVRIPGSIKWRRVFEIYPYGGRLLVTLDNINGVTIGFNRQDELEATRG